MICVRNCSWASSRDRKLLRLSLCAPEETGKASRRIYAVASPRRF